MAFTDGAIFTHIKLLLKDDIAFIEPDYNYSSERKKEPLSYDTELT